MKFQVGDKYLYRGTQCEVIFTNQDHAWIAPIKDCEAGLKNVAIAKVNANLSTSTGKKLKRSKRKYCGAV